MLIATQSPIITKRMKMERNSEKDGFYPRTNRRHQISNFKRTKHLSLTSQNNPNEHTCLQSHKVLMTLKPGRKLKKAFRLNLLQFFLDWKYEVKSYMFRIFVVLARSDMIIDARMVIIWSCSFKSPFIR